jgi:UPF0176 protein
MLNVLFYKFKKLNNLQELKNILQDACASLGLKGKILLADEGVNGCVSGCDADIEQFKGLVTSELVFGHIEFKVANTKYHSFKKMHVRLRKEIITFRHDVDLSEAANYIEPLELKKALDAGEDIVLLDSRNDYESTLGKFKGAITPRISLFSELPEKLNEMAELRSKNIVTYCTGGIRCEKSARWMLENGFTNVRQLRGGIIKYGQDCGNSHWSGKCFVFDRRGAIDLDPLNQSEPITQCLQCFLPCSDYKNCANLKCDKRIIICTSCLEVLQGCCSKQCRKTNFKPLRING